MDSPESLKEGFLPIGKKLLEIETQFILETLEYHGGNRTRTAETLGISVRTLRNKIALYKSIGIEVAPPTSGFKLDIKDA